MSGWATKEAAAEYRELRAAVMGRSGHLHDDGTAAIQRVGRMAAAGVAHGVMARSWGVSRWALERMLAAATCPRCGRRGEPTGRGSQDGRRRYQCRSCRRYYTPAHTRYERRVIEAVLTGSDLPTRTGLARRVRGLAVQGWPIEEQARMVGVSRATLHNVALERFGTPKPATVAAIVRLAEAIGDRGPVCEPGSPQERGSKVARTRALKNGWHPLAAWENIDDPTEQVGEELT